MKSMRARQFRTAPSRSPASTLATSDRLELLLGSYDGTPYYVGDASLSSEFEIVPGAVTLMSRSSLHPAYNIGPL